jgi:hypothetical protein
MKTSEFYRMTLASLIAPLLSGCAIIVDQGSDTRDIYVVGYARLRVPKAEAVGANARALEITGVGVAISHYFQLGYFKEFQAVVKPETNSAVIVLRSDADLERIEALLKTLNQNGLCLIINDRRS